MPKRKGKLRKDEFVESNFISGEQKIKRTKRLNIFGSNSKNKGMW